MSGPPGFEHGSEHDPRRGRHRRSAAGARWTPQVPAGPGARRRHALTPEEQNATTNPLPLASLPISGPPARHSLESPPQHGRQVVWPTSEPDPEHAPQVDAGTREPGTAPAAPSRADSPTATDGDQPGQPDLFAAWAVDPLADTASMGLQKFNIGTVPASVTPPVSAKRAAWFSVAAAAGALVSLIAVSSAFVRAPGPAEQIGALPGVPPFRDAPALDTNLPPEGFSSQSNDRDRNSDDRRGETGDRDRSRPPGGDDRSPARPPAGGADPTGQEPPSRPDPPSGSDGGSGPGGPGAGGAGAGGTVVPSPPTGPPQIIIGKTPPNQRGFAPPVNGRQIADRTVQYFELVAEDPAAAHAMTSGTLRAEGPGAIRQRYPDATDVHVRTVYANPGTAETKNLVTITKSDGSSMTEKRTLRFTRTGNPKIESDA